MTDDYAPNQVASDYMGVSETLMIFTPIRFYWENKKEILNNCLFIKDGPLSLRATLAKLSAPIRRFFDYAKSQGIDVAMMGQEKSGQFYDHLQLIGNSHLLVRVLFPTIIISKRKLNIIIQPLFMEQIQIMGQRSL